MIRTNSCTFIISWALVISQTLCVAIAQSDLPPGGEARTIQFPEDRSLGVLYAAPGDIQSRKGFNWFNPEFVRIGVAQGNVELPPDSLVRLDVSKDACKDLSPLSQIPPDSIHGLYFNIDSDPSEQFDHIGKLTGLRFIYFRSVPLSDGRLLKLVGLTNLEHFYCEVTGQTDRGFGVNDRALMVIARFKNLKRLSLRSNPVTDAGIRHLVSCQQLEILSLDGTKVTGEGLTHLQKLPHLKSLSFGAYQDGAPIDDQGMEVLGQMRQITYLSLNGTKVTDEGMKHISGLENLEDLSLDYTRVTDEGLASLAGMKSLKSLRFQKSGMNSLGDTAAEHLSKVPNLERVVGRWRLTQKGFEHLGKLKKIKSLTFDEGVSDDHLDYIAPLASLEYLGFDRCSITDEGIKKIAKLPNLKSLLISRSEVSGACLEALAQVQTLERLSIEFKTFGPEVNWNFLGEMRGLKSLDVTTSEFGKTACLALAKLSHLKELEIAGTPAGPDFYDAVSGMQHLESLKFHLDDVDSESWQKLAGLSNLEYLDIHGDITDEQLMLLADLPSLRIFQNRSERLTLLGIEAFTKKSKSLQSFFHPLTRKD